MIFSHLSTAGGAGLEFWVNDNSLPHWIHFQQKNMASRAMNYNDLLTVHDISQGLKGKTVLLLQI